MVRNKCSSCNVYILNERHHLLLNRFQSINEAVLKKCCLIFKVTCERLLKLVLSHRQFHPSVSEGIFGSNYFLIYFCMLFFLCKCSTSRRPMCTNFPVLHLLKAGSALLCLIKSLIVIKFNIALLVFFLCLHCLGPCSAFCI